jgi:hypothetical protein
MKTYIHIGYPKNASTSLQTDFFPNIEGAYYLGCKYGCETSFVTKEFQDAMTSIAMHDSIDFSYQEVKEKIESAISGVDKKFDKMILSWEAFSNNVADRGAIAERLNHLFPDASILIVIRNQLDSLQSMYSFLVQQLGKNINLSYGRPSIESFEKWVVEQEEFPHRSYLRTLKYYELIKEYQRLFGKEKVTVVLFEELVASPRTFFDKIHNFLNASGNLPSVGKSNKGPTKNQMIFYKLKARFPNLRLSRYFPRFVIALGKKILLNSTGNRTKEELPAEVQARLLNLYRGGNQKLQEELKMDLAKYGYIV